MLWLHEQDEEAVVEMNRDRTTRLPWLRTFLHLFAMRAGMRGLNGRTRLTRGAVCSSAFLSCLFVAALPCARAAATSFPNTPIHTNSAVQPVTVTITKAGTASTIEVLTLGAAGLDYQQASGGSCASGAAYTVSQNCSVAVQFTPLYAGVRPGAVVLLDNSKNVLGMQLLTGLGEGAQGVFVPGTINTVAGDGNFTTLKDGGPATSADLNLPFGLAVDGVGNLYIADSQHYRIRKVDAQTGDISTIAGTGTQGDTGDNSPATAADIGIPDGLAIDGAGDLFFADEAENVVRRIDGATGTITTVAGTGAEGFYGDGGAATAAHLDAPAGITVDGNGNLYIADTVNNRIRRVDTASGLITTVAGGGTGSDGGPASSASLNLPYGVAFDATGNMFIPDSGNNRIRRVDAATAAISTVAGTGAQGFSGDGGAPTAAALYSPFAVAIDPAGNLYIADTQNYRVRKVVNGVIDTVAGDGAKAYGGDLGSATAAGIYAPFFIFLDSSGSLYVAEYYDHRIRKVSSNAVTLVYPNAIRVGQTSPPQTQGIENDGNGPLTFSSITPDANAAVDSATTTCSVASTFAPDQMCAIGAEFAPTEVGNPVDGHIASGGNFGDAPLTITVVGQALALNSTSVSLASSGSPSTYGQTVEFIATVSTGTGTPSGSVIFKDGSTTLGTGPLSNSGTAQFSTAALLPGAHSITALYGGDSDHGSSTSGTLTQVVDAQAATTLDSSANPAAVTSTLTLTAHVAQSGVPASAMATPTGTVFFEDGSTVLGSQPLDSSGAATFSTAALAVGIHSLTARYTGDSSDLASTSATLSESIAQQFTTTMAASGTNPSIFGNSVTFSATVTVNGNGSATGSVAFYDGSSQIGSATLSSSGSASFASSSLAAGTHALSARYQGDTDNAASSSASFSQVVQKAQTQAVLSASPTPGIAGKPVTLSVIVTDTAGAGVPSGTASFSDNGSALGQATLGNNGSGSLNAALAPGTHALVVSYAGDANHASSSGTLSLSVQQASTTIAVTAAPNPSVFGNAVNFTVSVQGNGGIPTGAVTLLVDGSATGTASLSNGSAKLADAALGVGSHQVTATYAGDANDGSSTTVQAYMQTVQKAAVSLALTSSSPSNTVVSGTSVTFTAGLQAASGLPVPTGTVQFLDNGTTLGTSTINPNGMASYSTAALPPGSHTIMAVYGGDANYTGASSTLSEDVQHSTTASLSANVNPSVAGTPVTFTMSVSGTSSTPTGSITLLDSGSPVAIRSLNGAGTVTYQTSALAAGTHPLTASYAGDANNGPAISTVLSQTVHQATTSTGLTANPSPSIAGKVVLLTASVNGSGATPGGKVSFLDDGQLLGTATLNSSGVGALSTSTLAPGPHSLTAAYAGDANDAGSSSAPYSLSVQQATTTLVLSASANPAVVTRPVLLTAAVAGNGGAPTGTVIFKLGNAVLGSAPIGANGTASLSTNTLPLGSNALSAVYGGDRNDGGSQSTLTEVVQQATPVLQLQASPNPSLVAGSVTVKAQLTNSASTPTGTVTFASDNVTLGSAQLSPSGTASFSTAALTLGSHTLTAAYSGDMNDAAANSPAVTQIVQQTTTTQLGANINPVLGGTPVTFRVQVNTASGSLAIGTILFKDGAVALGSVPLASGAASLTLSSLAVGMHSITAAYSGDTLDAASTSQPLEESVQSALTTVSLASSGSPAVYGANLTFSAQVSGSGAPLTGTVSFTDSGASLRTVPIAVSGQAAFSTTALSVGIHSITAAYSGDANHGASGSAVLTQVVQAPSTTILTASPPSTIATTPVLLQAQISSGQGMHPEGTVTFHDGSVVLGSAPVNAASSASLTVSTLASGMHAFTAVYSGDTLDAPSTSSPAAEAVQAIPTTVHLGASAASVKTGDPFTMIGVVASGYTAPFTGTMSFFSGTTLLGQSAVDASGTATLAPSLAAGRQTLLATYNGDAFNAPSSSSPLAVTIVQAADFSEDLSATSLTMATKQNSTLTIQLASLAGFSDQISLGCAALPALVSCTFSKTSVALAANGTASVMLTVDTSSPLTSGGVASVRFVPQSFFLALCLPGSFLFGSLHQRKTQRKHRRRLLSCVTAAVAITVLTISGCSGLSSNGTAPGTYHFQITGTGTATGITHTVDVTLKVTE